MFDFILALVCALVSVSLAEPTLGIQFSTSNSSLPTLTLPYGTWQAARYDSVDDIYTFTNIRFAAPPVGDLRWAKPAPPKYNATLQDGSYGNACPQAAPAGLSGAAPPGFMLPPGAEDCLFLDIYVPGSALKNSTEKLPVVVWTYGGAFILGFKDQGFDGTGPISQSGNKMILVTYNYRVGSFGFLAGTTMEQEGLPNAGFYDQRAAFQWVQDYIHLVGGNARQVTAWGESAGAGSLLHHITAFGGKQAPLFHKVVMQSIASELLTDRRGEIEGFYQEFASYANCTNQTLSCLRSAPSSVLMAANTALVNNAPPSAFKPGPSADGKWIRQVPALELASGNYYKNLSGLILSHVAHEGDAFAIGSVESDAQFVNLTNFIIPAYVPTVRAAVAAYYPSPNATGSPYATQDARTIQYLDDTNFLCNYRYLNDAFDGRTWSMQYSILPAFHGTDVPTTFFNPATTNATAEQTALYRAYQSYLTSFSITGNPNTNRVKNGSLATVEWPHTMGHLEQNLRDVLNVTDAGYAIITDQESLKSRCDFFLNVQAAVTTGGGYVPPGGLVPNTLGVVSADPSRNYNTPAKR